MIRRNCVCGNQIPPNFCLCASCQKKYGMDRSKWEKWLVYMVADLDREYKQEVEISEHEDTFTDLESDKRFREECDEQLDFS